MRSLTIPDKGYGRGEKCVECRRVLRPGDCGFVHRLQGSSWVYHTHELWWHRACLEQLMAKAPLDASDYASEFARLQEHAKNGELFQ